MLLTARQIDRIVQITSDCCPREEYIGTFDSDFDYDANSVEGIFRPAMIRRSCRIGGQ